MNNDEIEVFSVDAKDKLRLGGPVVSRHIKVSSYSLIRDNHSIPDHDFPSAPGYKYIPDEYMNLRHKAQEDRLRRCRSLEALPVSQNKDKNATSSSSCYDDMVHPLVSRKETQSAKPVDSLGRTHLKYPRTRPLRIKLRT